MNRGVDRQTTFFDDRDRLEFGQRLADVFDRFGVETVAYCLMDNHYHLVLNAPFGDLGRAMHHLGLVYTQRTNERVGRDGPLFRGRYHSIPITTDAYLVQAVRYVHRNPLAMPGVRTMRDWRWSSYRVYLGLRRPPAFLRTDAVMGLFGGDRHRLERFTEQDSRLPESASSVADLVQVARLAIAVDDVEHGVGEELPRWQERTALLLVAERLNGHPLGERLLESFDFPSPSARRMALHRARGRASDVTLARIVDRTVERIAGARAA